MIDLDWPGPRLLWESADIRPLLRRLIWEGVSCVSFPGGGISEFA